MAQRSRKRRRGAIYKPISFLLMCVAIALGVSVFFKVAEVTVEGNSVSDTESIIVASGIQEGDYLFAINSSRVSSRIIEAMPYVEKVSVDRKLPGTVVINVTERVPVGYFFDGTSYWIVDKDCTILERKDSLSGVQSMIHITGVTPILPSVGDTIAAGESNATKVKYLAETLSALYDKGLCTYVHQLDITNANNLTFDYDGRLNVEMGKYEMVEYKIDLFLIALDSMADGETGTVDLSTDKVAHVIPN